MENFWLLLKRSIKGTYVSVEPFHLFRYLDEQSFRYNERHDTDAQRFQNVLGSVAGKRFNLEPPDQSGGGVMSQDPKLNAKLEEENPQPKPKKPPGYRNFEKILKQVIKIAANAQAGT